MRTLTILTLLAISTVCFGQDSPAGNASSAEIPVVSDIAKMTPEQLEQFRCEQTRAQIRDQLNRMETQPSASDRDSLASLRRNESVSCVPPLVSPPESAATLPATYPAQAMRQRHQGVVIVRVELAEDGSVKDNSIYKSSGFRELDRSALDAVRSWHFDTQKNSSVRVPVSFSLAH